MVISRLRHAFQSGFSVVQSIVLVAAFGFHPLPVHAAVACPLGSVINVVAHEDDDLLFLSPDLVKDVKAGLCVQTVFLTAGDAGNTSDYWLSREAGARAAYAKMAGVSNTWTQSDAGISGHAIPMYTLSRKTTVSVAYLRLPDGAMDGTGFDTYDNQSLKQLWTGAITNIVAVNEANSFTKQDLINTLASFMDKSGATQVRAQDYLRGFDQGDHDDHIAAAYFAQAAHLLYTKSHKFTGYQGYPSSDNPTNVSGTNLTNKKAAFYAYAAFDAGVCGSDVACADSEYLGWLKRQYIVGTQSGGGTPSPSPTASPTPSTSPAPGSNIAGQATVTASSQNTATSQQAIKAVDGIAGGYPNDYTREWATIGGHAGSWLNLAWSTPRTISRIVLRDRPNSLDQITSGTITFSDGTSITVPTLTNDGSAVTLTFPAKTVTSLRLNITGVSSGTANIGLSEIEVY